MADTPAWMHALRQALTEEHAKFQKGLDEMETTLPDASTGALALTATERHAKLQQRLTDMKTELAKCPLGQSQANHISTLQCQWADAALAEEDVALAENHTAHVERDAAPVMKIDSLALAQGSAHGLTGHAKVEKAHHMLLEGVGMAQEGHAKRQKLLDAMAMAAEGATELNEGLAIISKALPSLGGVILRSEEAAALQNNYMAEWTELRQKHNIMAQANKDAVTA
jgi:hypothetical protein